MGLDMALSATQYYYTFDNSNEVANEIKKNIQSIKDSHYSVTSTTIEVAYWRKANAIHKWFVDNVQDSVDDCDRYYVERGQLKELMSLCEQVEQDNSKAEKLLPTQNGFFFGSGDYDSYYFDSIRETISMIEEALALPECWSFYYQSSW